MAKDAKHGGAGIYVVVALILGVITYVEFAIVEFDIAWLSTGQTLFWLILLSVVKFWMVIWFFMHLRDDPKIYTGFFSSGMLMAMGTFVALSFMFILPAAVAPVVVAAPATVAEGAGPGPDANLGAAAEDHDAAAAAAAADDDGHGGGALGDDVLADIESDGDSRPMAERIDTPRPADQSLRITPPMAPEVAVELDLDGDAVAAAAAEADAPVEEEDAAAAEADPTVEEDAAAAADEPLADTAADEPLADAAAEAPAPDADVSAAAVADPSYDRELGASVYAANCVACHQSNGAGLPGAFPPVAGHAADLYVADGGAGGRAYLIDVLLYGLQGPIIVDGNNYAGLMPAWQHLSDEQLAAVTNYVVAGFGDEASAPAGFDAITADEVAAQRGLGLSGADVHALREELGIE